MKCIKNKISPEPVAGVHNIHDTVSTGGRYSLYLLVALQVVVVLILLILLGIDAAAIKCDCDSASLTSSISLQKTNLTLSGIDNTLSELQSIGNFTAGVVDDILPMVEKMLNLQNVSSIINSIKPNSCKDIKAVQPNSPTGYYHVNSRNIYCNMDTLCGSGGGWTRIGYLDMTQPTHSCPSALALHEEDGYRFCRRSRSTLWGSCNSVIIQNNGISYSQICGKVTAYQYRKPNLAVSLDRRNYLDSYYLDGISITRGSPRQHVWSLMVGLFENPMLYGYTFAACPCAIGSTQSVPSFVGNNYFCESGNPSHTFPDKVLYDDALWDGKSCGPNEGSCCSDRGQPWFHRDYGTNTITDYIELRVCSNRRLEEKETMVSKYEIYVK